MELRSGHNTQRKEMTTYIKKVVVEVQRAFKVKRDLVAHEVTKRKSGEAIEKYKRSKSGD